MEDLAKSELSTASLRPDWRFVSREDRDRTFRSEITNANEPLRFEDANDFAEVFVALRKKRFALTRWEFVRRAIATGFFKEG
jgi:hypothetical protein